MFELGKREKIILTFLKYGPILGKTKFQQMLYIAKMKYFLDIPFNFINYDVGPYSPELEATIDRLKLLDMIKEKRKEVGIFKSLYEYSLTSKGKLYITLNPFEGEEEIKNVIDKLKEADFVDKNVQIKTSP